MAETIVGLFPEDISYGSSGGPGYSTDVVTVTSGVETRNINWVQSRHAYNAASGIRNQDYLSTLIAFFHSHKGKAIGFEYKDWADYTATNEPIVDGILQKNYSGTLRPITNPKAGYTDNGDDTWTGEFFVPCRFDTDTLNINLEMYQHGSVDVPIVELRV